MKKVLYLLTSVFATFALALSVNAASGSITATTSSKTAVVGSTFTVTVKVSCSEALGSWQFGISYDSAYISLQSGDTNVAAYGDGSAKTKTYTYRFKAIKAGKAGVRISSPGMVSWNDVNTLFTPSVSNTSVTVKTQAQIEASYSKDNYLKSLSVEGYELSPKFDKGTTKYSVQVPEDITAVNVKATENDSRSTVRGTGSVDISEGINKIEVVVTAQNGQTRTYTIEVEVKDLNPIEVTVGGKEYTIVKKTSLLIAPTGYSPTTIKLNDIEVPAFRSEITKLTVVGLKDDEGTIGMFVYNEDDNSYEIYREIKASSLTLYPMSAVNIPKGFDKDKIIVNDIEYEAFKKSNNEAFIIVYAMNVEDGNTGYYLYDKDENTFIRYNAELFEEMADKNQEYLIYLAGLLGISVILFLISIIQARKNAKLKSLILKLSNKDEVGVKERSEEAEKYSKKNKKSKNIEKTEKK